MSSEITSISDKENYFLVGPGPANCSPRVLTALSSYPILPPGYQIFKVISEVKQLLKYAFQTQNDATLAIQNSGTGGLEAAIINTVDPKEVIIVAVNGYWGERVAEIGRLREITVIEIVPKKPGVFTFEELEEAIKKHKPVLLFITHGESSTGLLQPLKGLGNICHKYNCLLAIDAVVTLGGCPLFVDDWSIDIAVSAPQKAARGLPGLSYLTFSPKAVKRIRAIKTKPPFYYNILKLCDVWKCFDQHSPYYYTFNSNLLYAAREGLLELLEETLSVSCDKHKKLAKRLWSGLEKLGFEFIVKKPEDRLWTVTPVYLPPNISWAKINEYLTTKYQLFVGCGLGSYENKIIRIGIMGYNARDELVQRVLDKLQEALLYCQK
ncbi:hypothetical protein RN001_011874 [Aquatica leii]|uniref:Alanine--glyoxylate aminotransferase n=1 Tax=Aquatica leii TaxID=1421715 RepID=A0AAN7PTI6_9COLE|nr:hypothetical protein RN001_011874 [Aquatica leii]